jgi:hypothetical protein
MVDYVVPKASESYWVLQIVPSDSTDWIRAHETGDHNP